MQINVCTYSNMCPIAQKCRLKSHHKVDRTANFLVLHLISFHAVPKHKKNVFHIALQFHNINQ